MLLTSHIIISGLIGAKTGNYFLAAAAGLISHYVLDAIPHWDGYLDKEFQAKAEADKGFIRNKFFRKEIAKVAADFSLGLIIFYIFFGRHLDYGSAALALTGIFFGILPDPLQLLYWLTKSPLLKFNYDLQHVIHQNKKQPDFTFGMLTQIITIALAVYFYA